MAEEGTYQKLALYTDCADSKSQQRHADWCAHKGRQIKAKIPKTNDRNMEGRNSEKQNNWKEKDRIKKVKH